MISHKLARTVIVGIAFTISGVFSVFAQTPVFQVIQNDAVTGDNTPVPGIGCSSPGCYLPDANAPGAMVDSYTYDTYERPTSPHTGANFYYPALDIVSGQVGYDTTWLYYRINLYGPDGGGNWLPYFYGFEINFDADARGDIFVRVKNPSGGVGQSGAWDDKDVEVLWDQNDSHGTPRQGIPDPGTSMDGYENKVFEGKGGSSTPTNNAPGRSGQFDIRVRLLMSGGKPSIELAVRRVFLRALNSGLPVEQLSFQPYAGKGGAITGTDVFPFHDKYDRLSTGSPFPWLAQTGAPASCPSNLTAENNLTASQRDALDSGTRVNTGIPNPCYPGGGNIQETDNAGSLTSSVLYFYVPISGRVFEDVNYGGGAGRACGSGFASPASCVTTSGAVGRANARVELYSISGGTATFFAATTTDANGDYDFSVGNGFNVPGNASYLIRVVNATVTSSRPGGNTSGLIPVQTFRSIQSGNNGIADVNRVGGEQPSLVDAGNGVSGTTMNVASAAFTAGITGQAQSITVIAAGVQPMTGFDFGYNFDTVVNPNNSGQGSLSQFILNSNALGGEASLAQSGNRVNAVTAASEALPAGKESSIFMIPSGSAVAGQRAGLSSGLSAGVALITSNTGLPQVQGTHSVIDGGTQTFNIGNTNAGTLGTVSTAGVDAVAIPVIQRPEVEIRDDGSANRGIEITSTDVIVRGLSITGFGNNPANNNHGNILLNSGATRTVIEQSVIGSSASSFTDPGANRSGGDNIRSMGADDGILKNNLIGFSAGNGFSSANGNGSLNWLITSNEIRGNGITSNTDDGISLGNSSNATIEHNLLVSNLGSGISVNTATIRNNTVRNNGAGASNTPGIHLLGSGSSIDRNSVQTNFGAGVMVNNNAVNNIITRNSIFNNGTTTPTTGQIGIDLLAASDNAQTGTAPFITLNDNGDGDTGGNGLLNYPVIERALIQSGNLELTGFARPGAIIELFIAAQDPTGFGEGQTYLITLTEGSVADLDNSSATYGPTAVNSIAQGTDNTNRFRFIIPVPSGVATGTALTATATIANNTSEFSGVVIATAEYLRHQKTLQVLNDPVNGTSNPKSIPGAEVEYTLTITGLSTVSPDANSLIITDPLNNQIKLCRLNQAAGPVNFTDGTAPNQSGLNWTYTALNSNTDDIDFSNNNAASWNYIPNPDTEGCDHNITNIRMNPKGTFNPVSGGNNPVFFLKFNVIVK